MVHLNKYKMSLPYWIVDDAIIFKPSFDDSLETYSNIISNYRILIFSNYDDPYMTLNNDCVNNCILYKKNSLFNHSLGNSLLKLTNLEKIIFGHYFRQSLEKSLFNLINLRELTFDCHFNYQLRNSLSKLINLEKLTFGENFNRPLGNSLSKLINLQKLTFGCDFNQYLGNSLSSLHNLRILTFDF